MSPGLTPVTPGSLTLDPILATNNILKADGSADVAYVEFDFPSPVADVWATARVMLSADGLAYWAGSGDGHYATLIDFGPVDFVQIQDPTVLGDVWNGTWGQGSVPAPDSDAWHTFELHSHDGTLSEFFIDGETVWSTVAGSISTPEAVRFGVTNNSGVAAGQVAYFDNVKVGTTRGASDLCADDFSSGTLSAWTSTFGDVSVVGGAGTQALTLTPASPSSLTLTPA